MGLRVLVCPDKFKGSLSAAAAAEAIRRGVLGALPDAEVVLQPLADGGEGSIEVLRQRQGLAVRRCRVAGPLRKPVEASYLLGRGRAVIESAAACGLQLVPPARRHPKNTTTIGVGELIDDALARGAKDITLLLGGSATNDAGAGMAAALGYRFVGRQGEDFVPMADSLRWVDRIERPERISALGKARFTAVYDVTNPLLGERGSTHMYAGQKGAAPEELTDLEANMTHFSRLLGRLHGSPLHTLVGSGAAGGLGAGSVAFLNADLRAGTEVIFEAVDMDGLIAGIDLVITGEGKVDVQTLSGKVVAGVIALRKPTLVVCGKSELSAEQLAVERILSLMDREGVTEAHAILDAAALIETVVSDHLRHRRY